MQIHNPFVRQIVNSLTGNSAHVTAHARRQAPNHKAHVSRISRHSIGVVGFHERAFPIAKLVEPHAAHLQERIMTLDKRPRHGATTNITAAIRMATEMLNRRPNATKEIILVTDGQANEEVAGLAGAVAGAQRADIKIHAVGMGFNFDGRQLRDVANPTGGRVFIVRDLHTMAAAFGEMGHAVVNQRHGAPSALTVCVDYSGSMNEDFGGRTKLQACSSAVMDLVRVYTANHA